MRTAKLKLLAAAAVGLIGAGAIVAVGQDKKPAEGGKPDPAWNKEDEVPSAFPNIKPLGPKEIKEFAAKRVPPVLESDSEVTKLLKAKLRVTLKELEWGLYFASIGGSKVPHDAHLAEILKAVQNAVATGLELANGLEDRRAWLDFGVGVCKDIEQFAVEQVKQGISRPSLVWLTQRYRLDAEIALQKHIESAKGAAK
jgi:hypothetical protein